MKRMHMKLALIILLATVALKGYAAAVVMDAPSCKDWDPKQVAHKVWIEAYLSGIAMEKNDNFLEKTSLESIVLWVNRYCKANPKGEVAVAGVELALELAKRKRSAPR